MSTIAYLADADLAAGVTLTDTVALEVFWTNPAAVLDLIYGPGRRISGAAPAHDHDEDGGEPHHFPILQRSFGRYYQNLSGMGIPLGVPDTGSFGQSSATDFTRAKRLDCCMVVLPGGVSEIRISLTEYHEIATDRCNLIVALRSLSSVNYKLSVAAEEVRGEINYTTVGAAAIGIHSVTIDDLTGLGDPTRDREIEASLWLARDIDPASEQRILGWEIIAVTHTTAAREATPADLASPLLTVRELKAGLGLLSPQLGGKIKEVYNGLNRGLWGSTPGLLPDLQPDRRRRYQETITGIHQHQGSLCPQSDGSIVGDGAVLRDTQSFAYLTYLGETLPLVAATPPVMDHRPSQGAFLHFTNDLTTGWVIYRFRRSIPAGCGELRLRVGAHPGYEYNSPSFDTSQRLLVSVDVVPVGGGSSIVTRLFSGPFASPLDAADPEYGFVEVNPEESPAHLPNASIFAAGKKPWSRGAEVTGATREALQLNSVIYRVSEEIRVQLTYPPSRASETYHATGDYEVRIRFKMINDDGLCDDEAGCLWICCWNAPGY